MTYDVGSSGATSMAIDLDELVTHDATERCIVCHAQDISSQTVLPAVMAWEDAAGLPRFSVALHAAAGLLGAMLARGVPRIDVDKTLSDLLDDIERQIAEDEAMGGPPQGTA
jgi:hypothetical protein